MIFPQAPPRKTCMTWVKMFLHPNFQQGETLATRTDVMPPLKAQASCMSWSKICTWRISPLWVLWEPRSSSPPPRPEMSNVSWHVLSRTGYRFFFVLYSCTRRCAPHNVSCGQSTWWKHVQESPIIFGEVSLSLARWMAKWCSLMICHIGWSLSETDGASWNQFLIPIF